MREGLIALAVVGGFLVIRAIAATWFFLYLLPGGDRCPNCNAVTIRIESKGFRWFRRNWFRNSWCLDCGWHGLLRAGPLSPANATDASLAPK